MYYLELENKKKKDLSYTFAITKPFAFTKPRPQLLKQV